MSNAPSGLQAAIALHKAQRFDEAEKAYRKLLHGENVRPHCLRLLGALYLQTGQKALAAEFLEKAARLLPKDPETLTNLGVALRGVKRPDDAAMRFRQALDHKPDFLPALHNLANLCFEIGRIGEAEDVYERMIKLNPSPATFFHYGNSLLSSGKTAEAIACYEKALAIKPDYLEAIVNLGIALGIAGKKASANECLARAQGLFEKALEADPQNPVILNNLGNVLRQQGKVADALEAYEKALSIKPDYAGAFINRAAAQHDLGRLDDAIESCRGALGLKPESADARINLGTFLQEKGMHIEAVRLFSEALERQPSSIDAQWNKSLSLLALGDYREGWRLHECGLGVAHMRGAYDPAKRWNGEDIAGKRLLIRAEQGYGDSIQFVRYAALCKERGARVIVACLPALQALFSRCAFIDEVRDLGAAPSFDAHVPMMSLPYVFKTEVETIPASMPYLSVGAAARERWKDKIPDEGRLKVGLVWAGNPREEIAAAHLTDARRSMVLETLRPLFDVKKARFFSLQMGAKAGQIEKAGLNEIIDLMGEVRDFEDTAALIEQLDLVISVDTSVVHLAGAMGKPVWILSRFDACWRWLQNRPDSPWYPSARIFGQLRPGDWKDVVDRVRVELEELCAGPRA